MCSAGNIGLAERWQLRKMIQRQSPPQIHQFKQQSMHQCVCTISQEARGKPQHSWSIEESLKEANRKELPVVLHDQHHADLKKTSTWER